MIHRLHLKIKRVKKLLLENTGGIWDIDDTGEVKPFVATWVGSTFIRMEENPYPDKKIPFVLSSIPYLAVKIFMENLTHLLSKITKKL